MFIGDNGNVKESGGHTCLEFRVQSGHINLGVVDIPTILKALGLDERQTMELDNTRKISKN